MAYRDYLPLDSAFTDSRWRQSFVHCLGDPSNREDMSAAGTEARVLLRHRGDPAFLATLTVGDGLAALDETGTVAWDLPVETVAAYPPGDYDVEEQIKLPDGDFETRYTGQVRICGGLDGQSAGPPLNPNGQGRGSLVIVADTGGDKVFDGVGPRGPAGQAHTTRITAGPYTLTAADAFGVLVFDAAEDVEVIIPAGLPAPEFGCKLIKVGEGDVIVIPATGVTLAATGGLTALTLAYSTAALTRIDPDAESYLLAGATGTGPGSLGWSFDPGDAIELAGPGVLLGSLAGSGGTPPYSFALVSSDGHRFAVSGGQLLAGDTAIDLDDAAARAIAVRVTDAGGRAFAASHAIPVLRATTPFFDRPQQSGLLMVI